MRLRGNDPLRTASSASFKDRLPRDSTLKYWMQRPRRARQKESKGTFLTYLRDRKEKLKALGLR